MVTAYSPTGALTHPARSNYRSICVSTLSKVETLSALMVAAAAVIADRALFRSSRPEPFRYRLDVTQAALHPGASSSVQHPHGNTAS